MRKLKLQMQVTIDGYVAGPQGEMDWIVMQPDPIQLGILERLTSEMDLILLGRKMATGFVTYWEDLVDNQPESPEHPYASIFVDTPKIVFSKTNQLVQGRNLRMEYGDLVTAVDSIKKENGKDIIVYGGADFVSSLIEHKLIDELNLFVSPVSLGSGLRIFEGRTPLFLTNSTQCGNGIVVNQYALKPID